MYKSHFLSPQVNKANTLHNAFSKNASDLFPLEMKKERSTKNLVGFNHVSLTML